MNEYWFHIIGRNLFFSPLKKMKIQDFIALNLCELFYIKMRTINYAFLIIYFCLPFKFKIELIFFYFDYGGNVKLDIKLRDRTANDN